MIRETLMIGAVGIVCLASSCASKPGSAARTWVNPKDGMRFAWVPAGSFTAEVPVESKDPNDADKTSTQTITFEQGYWVGRTEVTLGQFRRFVKATRYVTDAEKAGKGSPTQDFALGGPNRWTWKNPGFPQRSDHPVVYVSFADALQYARWAGVDLPSEAQWLYACWAGAKDVSPLLDDRCVWHRGNTGGTGTRPVARKLPNAWGLYDMVGNAREYCKVGESGFATRGGSWTRCPAYRGRTGGAFEGLFNAEVSLRLEKYDPNPQYPPYAWDDDRGFRCIRRAL